MKSKAIFTDWLFWFVAVGIYMSVAWGAFQWRNPKANDMQFYRHFISVATFQRLAEFQ